MSGGMWLKGVCRTAIAAVAIDREQADSVKPELASMSLG